MLLAHGLTTGKGQLTGEGGRGRYSRRKDADQIGEADTQRTIFEAQTGKAYSSVGGDIADTMRSRTNIPTYTCHQIYTFF